MTIPPLTYAPADPPPPDREAVIASIRAVLNRHGVDAWVGMADHGMAAALYGRLIQYRYQRMAADSALLQRDLDVAEIDKETRAIRDGESGE